MTDSRKTLLKNKDKRSSLGKNKRNGIAPVTCVLSTVTGYPARCRRSNMLSSKPFFAADCESKVAGSCLGSPTCSVQTDDHYLYLFLYKRRKGECQRVTCPQSHYSSTCEALRTLLTITHLAWVCFRSWSGINVAGSRAYNEPVQCKV